MSDVHSKEIRSFNMSRVKGKNTKPEIIVRQFLYKNGFRFRLHRKDIPGKPDITIQKINTVIFVNGCFWHGHQGCKYFVIPKTRTQWWIDKISETKSKDDKNSTELRKVGWRVITIWECELKPANKSITLDRLLSQLNS